MFAELHEKAHSVDVATVDPANEGTIVHLSAASLSSALGVSDASFSIASPGFALRREVAMFQWFEKKHGRGLRARYEYLRSRSRTRRWQSKHLTNTTRPTHRIR